MTVVKVTSRKLGLLLLLIN